MNAVARVPMVSGAVAYDEIASRYDRVPVENRINGYMRRLSLARILETFPPRSRLLEVGCGTGDEALALAERGAAVVALDASFEMVRAARRKAMERNLEDRITFFRAEAKDLERLAGSLRGPFDGGYASFSLAYEPDLAPVAQGLHGLLRPGATFLASVPSRLCLVEFALALGTAHLGFAGRRLQPEHGHRVGTHLVPIRTYTPRAFAEAMGPRFFMRRVEALPAVVPPPYMNRVYARLNGFADVLERVDATLRARAPFRSLGDHFLAELVRV